MTSHALKMCTIKCIFNAILLEHNKSLKHKHVKDQINNSNLKKILG